MRELWKHQTEALERFKHAHEMALLHEMGVGKTATTIHWLRAKYNAHKMVLPTLIVSPVATLENWENEFKLNAPTKVYDKCIILNGSTSKRIGLVECNPGAIFITNPDIFDRIEFVHAIKREAPRAIVVDEAHRLKNPKSKRLKHLLYITDSAQYRAILTGTPILNTYLDIWAQWRILDKGATFGLNFFTFRERYFRDENLRWKGRPKYFPKYVPIPGTDKELAALVDRKADRVTKSKCLDLPPLVYKTEHVQLSKEQRKAYDEMEAQLLTEVAEGTCVASNALVRVLRLLQILSGYVQTEVMGVKLANPRLERLKELLEELTPQHKVIVWANFKDNYDSIQTACDELQIATATLHGETRDRAAEIQRFQYDPLCCVMIANPQAGGVGVNLTAASYSIYYSRSYSLGDRLQSEARNHRGGSEIHESITCIDLVAKGTLDEDVLAALQRKENFSDSILDRLKARC